MPTRTWFRKKSRLGGRTSAALTGTRMALQVPSAFFPSQTLMKRGIGLSSFRISASSSISSGGVIESSDSRNVSGDFHRIGSSQFSGSAGKLWTFVSESHC